MTKSSEYREYFRGCWADKVNDHPKDIIQSPALRAPEVRLGAGWGPSSDVWMLGLNVCII